jgi:hypothetical protein
MHEIPASISVGQGSNPRVGRTPSSGPDPTVKFLG